MSDCQYRPLLLDPIGEKEKVLNCDTCVPSHSGLERVFFLPNQLPAVLRMWISVILSFCLK